MHLDIGLTVTLKSIKLPVASRFSRDAILVSRGERRVSQDLLTGNFGINYGQMIQRENQDQC